VRFEVGRSGDAQSTQEMRKHGPGGAGIVESVMRSSGIDPELGAQRHQLVVGLAALTELPRQLECADDPDMGERDRGVLRGRLQETEIERRVVGDEQTVARQADEGGHHARQRWGQKYLATGDAVDVDRTER
jgi:hypothetical protein